MGLRNGTGGRPATGRSLALGAAALLAVVLASLGLGGSGGRRALEMLPVPVLTTTTTPPSTATSTTASTVGSPSRTAPLQPPGAGPARRHRATPHRTERCRSARCRAVRRRAEREAVRLVARAPVPPDARRLRRPPLPRPDRLLRPPTGTLLARATGYWSAPLPLRDLGAWERQHPHAGLRWQQADTVTAGDHWLAFGLRFVVPARAGGGLATLILTADAAGAHRTLVWADAFVQRVAPPSERLSGTVGAGRRLPPEAGTRADGPLQGRDRPISTESHSSPLRRR